jgi:hypothetical protein
MSRWQEEQAERNQRSLVRLSKALPALFPAAVLARALARLFIPPTPRLAIESYWRAHPMRADRLARALAARTGAPLGWRWRIGQNRKTGLPATFRTPPAPYRERAYSLGPGFCCVCGQAVYRLGWHNDLWGTGPNKNAVWHCACVVAWDFWNAPNKRGSSTAASPRAAVRPIGSATMEERRGRSPNPLVSSMEGIPRRPMAEATRLLGHAKPPGNQSRRPCHEMRHRGTRPTSCKLSRGVWSHGWVDL